MTKRAPLWLALALLLLFGLGASAQNITSITCWRSWVEDDQGYTSCYANRGTVGEPDTLGCSCAATCGSNCKNIGAAAEVKWDVPIDGVATVNVTGGAEASAVKVSCSAIIACGETNDQANGFDRQDCNGYETFSDFSIFCGGTSGSATGP